MKEISEQAKKLLIENLAKLHEAEKRAKADGAGIKEALEYFFVKNNISYLRFCGSLTRCPVPEKQLSCPLIVGEPDESGYYQWQPVPQTEPVDFSEVEEKLGFEIRNEIKEFFSSYFFFMLEGVDSRNREKPEYGEVWTDTILPEMNIKTMVLRSFDKSDAFFKDDFICKGRFCNIGGCNLGFHCELEVDNDTGKVYAWDFEEYQHYKIADSLRELILTMDSIWSSAEEDELFPLDSLQ